MVWASSESEMNSGKHRILQGHVEENDTEASKTMHVKQLAGLFDLEGARRTCGLAKVCQSRCHNGLNSLICYLCHGVTV